MATRNYGTRGGFIDTLIAKIAIKVISEAPAILERLTGHNKTNIAGFGSADLKRRADAAISQAFVETAIKKFETHFLPQNSTENIKIDLNKAVELRKFLRTEYNSVVGYADVSDLKFYTPYGSPSEGKIAYTRGDLIFDTILNLKEPEPGIIKRAMSAMSFGSRTPSTGSRYSSNTLPGSEVSEVFEGSEGSMGGKPKPKPKRMTYDQMTVAQLKERAKSRNIKGFSKLTKAELISVLRR